MNQGKTVTANDALYSKNGMEKKQAKKKSSLQPTPQVLVSCRGLDGEDNALAVGYCGNCSYDRPWSWSGLYLHATHIA